MDKLMFFAMVTSRVNTELSSIQPTFPMPAAASGDNPVLE